MGKPSNQDRFEPPSVADDDEFAATASGPPEDPPNPTGKAKDLLDR